MITRFRHGMPDGGIFVVVISYGVFAGLWILLSDQLMGLLFPDRDHLVQVSMLKGWFFVALTTILLYFLVRRLVTRIQLTHRRAIEAQAERARSMDLLAAIVENMEEAIYAKDLDGRYLLFNSAACRFVGKPVAEVLGCDDTSIFPGEQAELLIAIGRRVMANGLTETNEETLDTARGTRTFLATKGPLRDAGGKIFGIFGISRDITQHKLAEDDLRQSESRFRALVEQSVAGIYIIQDDRLRYVNPGFAAIFGYASANDIIDRVPVFDLVSPKYREGVAEHLRRRLEGEETDTLYYFTGLRRDGKRINVEGYGRGFSYLGRPAVIGLILDVSTRVEAERALRASEARFEDIVRASADWIWEIDAAGRYTYASDSVEALLGYTPAELLGKTPFELMPPDEAVRVKAEFEASAARMEMFRDLDNVNLHKDGSYRNVQTNGMPILAADGTLLGYRGLDRDVTGRKHAEAAMQKLADDMAATLQAIPDLLFEIDDEGRYLAVKTSQEALLAQPREQLLGRTVGEVLPPEAAGTVMAAIAAASRTGMDYGRTIMLPLAPKPVYFELSVARKLVGAGQREHFIVLSRDITARKAAEEELRQHSAEMERFHRATVGREIDMIAMKRQINALSQELGREPPYPLAFLNDEGGTAA